MATQPPPPPAKRPPARPPQPPRRQPTRPQKPATFIVRQSDSGIWKSLVIYTLVFAAAGIGVFLYYQKTRVAPPVIVQEKPKVETPVKLDDIKSKPETDAPPPPPSNAPDEPEPEPEKKEPVKVEEPFKTKLKLAAHIRKYDKPSDIDKKIWAIAPTQENPLRVTLGDKRQRNEIAALLKEYEAIPFDKVVANPLAADFPGSVDEAAERVIKAVQLPEAIAGWHSTGIYAPPGERLTIRISSSDAKMGMRVRIGCHRDDILNSKREEWHRFPRITRSTPLNETNIDIANPFGGAVYIEMPYNAKKTKSRSKARIEIVGGIEAPFYELGTTTPEEWKHNRKAPAPWAELAGKKIILSVPAQYIRTLDDPGKLMELWDKIIDLQDWLAAWPKDRRKNPERLVPDAEISAGWMHSGYPVMCYLASAKGMVDYEYLTTRGDWGFYHEYGHNHQNGAWTFAGYGEVTNNLFSLLCMEKISGHPIGSQRDLEQCLAAKIADPEGNNGAFENLSIYVPVIKAFGWEPLRKTFAEYTKKRTFNLKTDDKKKETFVRLWSKHCNANLGPYFEKVGFPHTNSMKTSLMQYKSWMPPLPKLTAGENTPSSLFGSKNESAATRDGNDAGDDHDISDDTGE